jgi:hypothetical protein
MVQSQQNDTENHHHLGHKIITACNPIKRVYDLTNPKNNMECYKVVKNILKKCEFPTRIINTREFVN